MWSLMAACDVLVNLRYPTMGETSGSVIRALSLGKPLLVSDVGWFSELPDDVVLKVPVDELRGRHARRRRSSSPPSTATTLGAAARAYVEREHDLAASPTPTSPRSRSAAGGDAVDDAVLWRIAEAAAEVGIDRHVARSRSASARSGSVREQSPRAVPGVGLARPRSSWSRRRCAFALRAPHGRPVDHDRRARLLRAREELRGDGSFAVRGVPTERLRRRLPDPDQPGVRALSARSRPSTRGQAINALLMSLAAVPAYLLARRVVSTRGGARRRAAHRRCPVDVLRRHGHDGERVLSDLPARRARARRAARAADALATVRASSRARRLRTRRAPRPSRCSPPRSLAPLADRCSSATARELARRSRCSTPPSADAVLVVLAELARGRSLSSLLGAYARRDALALRRRRRVARGSSGTSPSSISMSASSRSPRSSSSASAEGAVARPSARSSPRRSRWSRLLAVEVAAFASQPSVAAHRGAQPLLRRAAALHAASCCGSSAACRARAPRLVAAAVRRRRARRSRSRTSGSSTRRPPRTRSACSRCGRLQRSGCISLPRDIRWLVAGGVPRSLRRRPRRLRRVRLWWRLPGVLRCSTSARARPVDSSTQRASIGAVFQGITRPDRDWITAIVGSPTASASPSLWTGATDRLTVNENEFFNRDVGPIYTTNGPRPGRARPDARRANRATGTTSLAGRVVRGAGRAHRHEHLGRGARDRRRPEEGPRALARRRAAARRQTTTRDRLPRPVGGALRHLPQVRLHAAARLAVRLGSDAHLFRAPSSSRRTCAAASSRRRWWGRSASDAARCRSCAEPRGSCTVRFRIPRTRVPARVEPASTDTRELGITLPRLHCRREDRVRRQPALARADRDRQLHPRLARGAGRGRRASRTRSSRSHRRARGPAPIPEALAGHPDDEAAPRCRSRTTGGRRGAASAGRRSSAFSARSTSSTTPTGCSRRSGRACARR